MNKHENACSCGCQEDGLEPVILTRAQLNDRIDRAAVLSLTLGFAGGLLLGLWFWLPEGRL